MASFRDERIWRWLTNVWTVIYFVFLFIDFFSMSRYSFVVVPLSFLYIGILSIYVSTKEFDRWYVKHSGQHPGELFVALWTVVILALFSFSAYFGQEFELAHETVAVYIAILSIFAVTQRSKMLYREAVKRKEQTEALEEVAVE
ncbi:MAG: hypothetical protein AAB897_02830 [Patescibacteria group bacterium]